MHPLSEDVTTEDGKVLSSPAVTSVYYFSKILFCYMWPFFLFNFYIVNSLTSCYFSGWKRDLLLFLVELWSEKGVSTTDSSRRRGRGHSGASSKPHSFVSSPCRPRQNKDIHRGSRLQPGFSFGSKAVVWNCYLNGLPQWLPNNLPRPCKVSKLALSPYSTLWTDFTFRDCTKTRKLCWRFKGKEADSRLQRERETSRPDRVCVWGGVVYNFTPELNNFRFLAQCRAITP